MIDRRRVHRLCSMIVAAVAFLPSSLAAQDAPKILLDQPLRAVEYQLGRLSSEELILVERKTDNARYRPIYVALLTRKGIPAQYRDEALAALVTLDKTTRTAVLLDALGKVADDDTVTAEKLAGMVLGQPAEIIRSERATFTAVTENAAASPLSRRVAYDAMIVGDGKPDAAWKTALQHEGHIVDLLQGVRYLPAAGGSAVRPLLAAPVAELLQTTTDPATRAAALAALAEARPDAATFTVLAREVTPSGDEAARSAALASLQRIPESAWPAAGVEPLAKSIVGVVSALSPTSRSEPAALETIHLGERLAEKLPDESKRAIRRELRALGVQVVRIATIPEKLTYDVRWFAVEAGKAVQILLLNKDAMPHNIVIGAPGSLEAIGTQGSSLPMPTDPDAKAFIPDLPAVLFSTKLAKEGETERLGFTAPKEPGEYIFVCTFPGHWVRMYGVMLVVDSLEAWEAKPTVPTDPMTKQPFTSKQP